MAAKKNSKSLPSFESNLSALEALVDRLEQGDLPLEQALQEFEQGIKLARECQTALKTAEQKVEILMKKQADAAAEPFTPDNNNGNKDYIDNE